VASFYARELHEEVEKNLDERRNGAVRRIQQTIEGWLQEPSLIEPVTLMGFNQAGTPSTADSVHCHLVSGLQFYSKFFSTINTGLTMHSKFMVTEREILFGSYNFDVWSRDFEREYCLRFQADANDRFQFYHVRQSLNLP
jgi:hypothetical protein